MNERPDQSPLTSARSERVKKVAALTGRSARRKQGRFRIEGPQSVRSLLAHRPELALEVSIDLSGGPVGDLVERVAGRILSRNLRATLLAARRLLEDEA